MAAFHDSAEWMRDGVQTGHLVADSLEELHAVAAKMGLPRERFQGDALTPHYQLPETLYGAAAALGVKRLDRERFNARVAQINAAARGTEPELRRRARKAKDARAASRKDTRRITPRAVIQPSLL